MRTPGALLRETRQRHGVSQASLARRASTTQSAISRIERDRVSPRVETLAELLHMLGEELELRAATYDSGTDRSLIWANFQKDVDGRISDGLSFAKFVHEHRGIAWK